MSGKCWALEGNRKKSARNDLHEHKNVCDGIRIQKHDSQAEGCRAQAFVNGGKRLPNQRESSALTT